MAVGFASYEIARSGLTYNERGLDVTGHNIANVNTAGYSRQQAIAKGSFYIENNAKYGYGQVGTGVDIQQTRQIRHKFLDNIFRYENAKGDYWNVRSETFSEVENVLGESLNEQTNSGIQVLFNKYWDAWQELSVDPSSLTTRSLVRQIGESIAFEFNNIGAQFDQIQMDLDAQFVEGVDTLSELCARVAELNHQIRSIEVTREAPNDLYDERNLLLDQISSLADCEIYERDDGMKDVIVDGTYLVYRDTAKKIITKLTPQSGLFHEAFVVVSDNPPVHRKLTFGQCKLQGILESRGVSVELLDVGATRAALDLSDPLNTTAAANVMFARGSITNGSPNTAADIVVAIDVSDSSGAYLEKVKLSIDGYVDGLLKKGLDFNLKLVTYGGTATVVGQYTQDQANDFIADVMGLTTNTGDTDNNFGGAGGVLDALEKLDKDPDSGASSFRANANRYTVLFTAESIDGDESGRVTAADADEYAHKLADIGMSLSVVTANALQTDRDGTTAAPFGWNTLTAATGGASIDYNEVVDSEWVLRDFADVMGDANEFVERSVNDRISRVASGTQIIPEVRKRLNALVNIIVRDINELHRSGKTLEEPPKDGDDFFVPINAKYPLELGNIQINPRFLEADGLNYIVASLSGGAEDNIVARDIANLRNKAGSISTDVGATTFDDYYRDAIYEIANQAAETERFLDNQVTVAASLDEMRHSIMDVSMDEEMSYMMKFKFGYDAAARVLNVIDDMIETVVTRLGLVGR